MLILLAALSLTQSVQTDDRGNELYQGYKSCVTRAALENSAAADDHQARIAAAVDYCSPAMRLLEDEWARFFKPSVDPAQLGSYVARLKTETIRHATRQAQTQLTRAAR